MKRYRFGIDFNTEYIVVPAAHEHKEGEWVEADIAEEIYEALKDVCLEICPDKDREECPNGYNRNCFVLKALKKARGEGE